MVTGVMIIICHTWKTCANTNVFIVLKMDNVLNVLKVGTLKILKKMVGLGVNLTQMIVVLIVMNAHQMELSVLIAILDITLLLMILNLTV